MKAAVVILNWNGSRMMRRFLPEVIANVPPGVARIVVADNGSTDSSREMIAKEFPNIDVIGWDTNLGFAEGYNRAIREVEEPYILLLNSDAYPAPGCVATLLDFMESHPDCGACQPKLLSAGNPASFEYAGAAGGFIDRYGYPYCRGRIFSEVEDDCGQYDDNIEVDWATGACMMVNRAIYMQTGGLDPRFFAHMEEIDLCWRMRLAGYKIWAVGNATAFHLGGGSLPAGNPRKVYLNFRNNLLLLHKNLPRKSARRVIFKRRLLDTLAWARFVATFQWKSAASILRAHRDFRRMRKGYPSPSPSIPVLIDSRPNLLASYYLRRRRVYSRL